jgi:hypothetical protein
MIQLSDTQATILSAACAREAGSVLPITANLKGGAVGMVVTSLLKKELIEEIPAETGTPVWREDENGTPLTLRATAAAYAALGIEPATAAMGADGAGQDEPAPDMAGQTNTPPTGAPAPEAKAARKPRDGTKQQALIALLKRTEGASIAEIMAVTAWQAHTVRGAIAGALKKKLGLTVTSEKEEARGRVYKLDAAA